MQNVRRRTKEGCAESLYNQHKHRCVRNGYGDVGYTKNELYEWLIAQDLFHKLFDNWVAGGYSRWDAPSVDRKDDYKGYCFDNIQLMTWKENFDKGHYDAKNGINNKHNSPVDKYDLQGVFICSYHSASTASRDTGVDSSSIGRVCNYKQLTAGEFIWKWKNDAHEVTPTNIKKKGIKKKIEQYDLNFNLIKTHASVSEANRKTGLYLSDIGRSKDPSNYRRGGFIFKLI